MWNDFPLPLGPRQKKLALSVIFTAPSLPVMSMATGSPWRSVYHVVSGVTSDCFRCSLKNRHRAVSASVRKRS